MDQICIYEAMTFKSGRKLLTMFFTGEQLYYSPPMYTSFLMIYKYIGISERIELAGKCGNSHWRDIRHFSLP